MSVCYYYSVYRYAINTKETSGGREREEMEVFYYNNKITRAFQQCASLRYYTLILFPLPQLKFIPTALPTLPPI